MKLTRIKIALLLLLPFAGCNKYIDVVPDNVPTFEYAFRMRSAAQRYLTTCYSFMPNLGTKAGNPAFFGGDEMWLATTETPANQMIGRGEQNTNNPYSNFWNGTNSATNLWIGVSQCNIFLENIGAVPDMEKEEIEKWKAEVKTLKAYYYFFLLRMYGPIPVMRENIPIYASGDEVRVSRQPVDVVFNYIVELLDEAYELLPMVVDDPISELGRMTAPINRGIKATALVYAASPLFNGNTDYANFKDREGQLLFDQTYRAEKWEKAVQACKEAIDLAHSLGYKLYKYQTVSDNGNISEATKKQMNYRGSVTEEWNSEIIWANTNNTTRALQTNAAPRALNSDQREWQVARGATGGTMNIANLFYTRNGLPIDQDISWDYNGRFQLRTGTAAEKYNIRQGYTTAYFNFDREPRYYGGFGFDGGIWYGNQKYDDNNPWWLECKAGQYCGNLTPTFHSVTGIYIKKLINYRNTPVNKDTYSTINYAWPMLRLADLYLMYAEALNEASGPGDEVYQYLNMIREKAGIPTVQVSWDNYSKTPGKYTQRDGLREIIQQERTIEMAFEGQRFWDLRRWKTAPLHLNRPVMGWSITYADAERYYRPSIVFNRRFEFKDYFWPIREQDLVVNKKLVQNPGW